MGTVVDVAEDLADAVGSCRAEMESARRMPAPLAARLASAGLMRMGVTAAVGGPEVHPVDQLDVVERLARANPSAAWCVMISSTTALASGWMDPASADEVFADPAGVWAGTVAPAGRTTTIDGGLRLDGRWSFGSGCQNATWLAGGALDPTGLPVLCFVPAAAVTIIDNWDVVGLRGTGSHDWAVTGVEVPAGRVVSIIGPPQESSGPLYRMGLFGSLAAAVAVVGVGAARASIEAFVELAEAKTPTMATRPLAQRATVQVEVARAATRLDAARGHLRSTVAAAFDDASAGREIDVAARAALRRAATHAAETAAEVATTMFRLAGGTAIRDDAPFGRLLCDAQTVTQHLMVGPATWEVTGRQLMGLAVDRPDL